MPSSILVLGRELFLEKIRGFGSEWKVSGFSQPLELASSRAFGEGALILLDLESDAYHWEDVARRLGGEKRYRGCWIACADFTSLERSLSVRRFDAFRLVLFEDSQEQFQGHIQDALRHQKHWNELLFRPGLED